MASLKRIWTLSLACGGLLLCGHFLDGLRVNPKSRTGDEDGCKNNGGQLIFKFLPHNREE